MALLAVYDAFTQVETKPIANYYLQSKDGRQMCTPSHVHNNIMLQKATPNN